ncbi:hypothetical protein Vadar_023492 [Vaccinium darrowii]|uniref:Uncharacterized protein n=1 Tax=Vaccinium darrowii TaxID=229202 RepID=A0ACB7XBP7_9ERIC|nr:hypothetical protein Vadar_023492 [Vaccinium darrowii]
MEAEEFLESDILCPENLVNDEEPMVFQGHFNSENSRSTKPKMRERRKKKKNLNPINIPENISVNSTQSVETDLFEVDDGDDHQLVPPHAILDRRISDRKMAFPVFTGKGRTLKGTALFQFRDSVLRITGFLEGNVTPQQF